MPFRSALSCVLAAVILLVSAGVAAAAAPKIIVRASVSVSASEVLTGSSVTVSGTAQYGRRGARVALQRQDGDSWVGLRSSTLDAALHYTFSFRPPAGVVAYRVVVAGDPQRRAATSRTFQVTSSSCPTTSAPTSPTAAWFSRPGRTSRSAIATHTAQTLCAAAPGSTVHLAYYFVDSNSVEVEPVFRAIELMHRLRHVTFRIVMEGKHFQSSWGQRTLARIGSSATVRLCSYGCRSGRATAGVMHDKFITVSDTVWRAGKDPVLISSSGNLSHTQLRKMWQSSQAFYSDPQLVAQFDKRFTSLWACGGSGGCQSWQPTGAEDVMTLVNAVWQDAGTLRKGSTGRGTAVAFSPMPTSQDPLLAGLSSLSLTPTHDTVRIAMFKVTSSRTKAFADVVRGLRDRGCWVRVLLSTPTDTGMTAGLTSLKGLGVTPRCVTGLHDKVTIVDAVSTDTGANRTVVWSGSQNVTVSGLAFNDDTLTQLTVQDATGSYATAARTMWRAYSANWTALRAASVAC